MNEINPDTEWAENLLIDIHNLGLESQSMQEDKEDIAIELKDFDLLILNTLLFNLRLIKLAVLKARRRLK